MWYFALLLALIWGTIWAVFLQFAPMGRFLAQRRTWITVVIGVGVDLLIALLITTWSAWAAIACIITISSLPIILRSLFNEWRDLIEMLNATKDPPGQ